MITGRDYLAEVERRKDEMVRAQQHRVRRLASGYRASALDTRYRQALMRLGSLLVAWGSRLQEISTPNPAPELV